MSMLGLHLRRLHVSVALALSLSFASVWKAANLAFNEVISGRFSWPRSDPRLLHHRPSIMLRQKLRRLTEDVYVLAHILP